MQGTVIGQRGMRLSETRKWVLCWKVIIALAMTCGVQDQSHRTFGLVEDLRASRGRQWDRIPGMNDGTAFFTSGSVKSSTSGA